MRFEVGDLVELGVEDVITAYAWPVRITGVDWDSGLYWGTDRRGDAVTFSEQFALENFVRLVAPPAERRCDCSARDLLWNGHNCGRANSDRHWALGEVFE